MDAEIKVIDLTRPAKSAIVVVDRTTPGPTIRIEAEIPRRPVEFYFGPQPNCPDGKCPTPQANRPTYSRRLLR